MNLQKLKAEEILVSRIKPASWFNLLIYVLTFRKFGKAYEVNHEEKVRCTVPPETFNCRCSAIPITKKENEMEQNVEEKIKGIIAEQLSVDLDKIVPAASLVDDLGADSLDVVELIIALEHDFNIEISDDLAEKVHTVAEHINLVNELTEGI